MTRLRLFRSLPRCVSAAAAVLVALCGLASAASAQTHVRGEAAWPQAKGARADWLGAGYAGTAPRLDLSAPDPGEITAAQARNATAKAMQVGVPIAIVGADGRWTPTLDWRTVGDWTVARFEVTSPGARALRVELDFSFLPVGSEVRALGVADPVGVVGANFGEIEQQRGALGRYWTPLTEGGRQVIEIAIPAGRSFAGEVEVGVTGASHLFTSYADGFAWTKAAAACNVNVACLTSIAQAVLNASRSVARMVFTDAGRSFFCTGTLLNDTDPGGQIPYFLTANHCIDNAAAASTLITRWGYETPSCISTVAQEGVQLSGGAALLATSSGLDLTLLRLNNPAPAGSFFSGWDASGPPAVGSDFTVIHHPTGDVKKVSLGRVTGIASGPIPSLGLDAGGIIVGYTSGTTEGGSSGSALMSALFGELVVRGALTGGVASCSNVNDFSPGTQNIDYFSRLDLFFPAISSFLAPAPAGPTVVEYYLSSRDQYFYTADAGEQGFVDGGGAGPWLRTGKRFGVGGPTQVCRFYGNTNTNPATGAIYGPASHFYTADAGECNFLRSIYNPAQPSWRFESFDFVTSQVVQGACPASTVPVYRAYNNGITRGRDSNHRLSTAQADIAEVVARGWRNEGIVMCARF